MLSARRHRHAVGVTTAGTFVHRLPIVYGMTASASISTSSAGSISLLTSTMEVAGRIAAKTSPCARPTSSHQADVSHEHPGPYDVLQPRTSLLERKLDAAQRLTCLILDVVTSDRVAALGCCCRAGDRHPLADAHRP